MIGITAFGAYVPATRLPLALSEGRTATEGGPERSVAGHDEDAITMAVAAAIDCLHGTDRASIDMLLLASTSLPFREKSGAALVAKALGLRRDVATVDLGSSLRAGLSAVKAAHDAVAAGSARGVLVIATDCRAAVPRSPLEREIGDGAAAFLIGRERVAAEIVGFFAVNEEIVDLWRGGDDPFLRRWEDRFVVQHGYLPSVEETIRGALGKSDLDPTRLDRLALAGPDSRSIFSAAKACRIPASTVVDPLFGRLGHTGTSFAPLLLISALESSHEAGNPLILCVAHGNGAEAVSFRATTSLEAARPPKGLAGHLGRRRALRSYQTFLAGRRLASGDDLSHAGGGVPATVSFRERDSELPLMGFRCERCATVHFPRQRVCYRCFSHEGFQPHPLSTRPGRVLSYTFDWFFPNPEPPTIAGVVEVEGARLYVQMTDASPAELRCDLPVEMTFRRIHEAGGRPNYFWKSTPLRGSVMPAAAHAPREQS